MTFEKVEDMRYGENPHQKAAFYREIGKKKGSLVDAKQLNGKSLSFNNINDTNGALELLKEFTCLLYTSSRYVMHCIGFTVITVNYLYSCMRYCFLIMFRLHLAVPF